MREALEDVNNRHEREASAQAGKALNVSPTYVKQAKKLKAEMQHIGWQAETARPGSRRCHR